jgi:signal transduction histidine kinase
VGENRLPGGTWLALTAGAAPWSTAEQRSRPAHQIVCALIVLSWVVVVLTMVVVASRSPAVPWPTAAIGALAVGLLAFDPLLRLLGRPPASRSASLNFIVRALGLLVVSLALLAMLHGWQRLGVVMVGSAIGADGALTADDLGVRADVQRWWREFLFSAFHFGVLGGLIGVLVLGSSANARFALASFVCLHLTMLIALFTTWVISLLLQRDHLAREQTVADVKEDERRRRAHWLHDDICAQIRLISLRLQTDVLSRSEIIRQLDQLDHSLRLRQLDELFGAGAVRVAEVLQPYIRYAQNLGAQIDSVPAFEQAALVLDESDARRLSRAVSVLTSNALNAGASHLTIELSSGPDELQLTVTDNGPGFTEADVQPGRGLWTLRDELGPDGGIEHSSTARGARVAAIIHLQERSRIVENLVG